MLLRTLNLFSNLLKPSLIWAGCRRPVLFNVLLERLGGVDGQLRRFGGCKEKSGERDPLKVKWNVFSVPTLTSSICVFLATEVCLTCSVQAQINMMQWLK